MLLLRQSYLVYAVWTTLVVAALISLWFERWSMGFVAVATLVASILPAALAARYQIRLPLSFVTFTVLFIFATLFLGEAFDFYETFWWWDIGMHGLSSVGFGLVGFIIVFYLFEGDRYAAPPWAVAFFGFCFAVAIGTAWEIFEYLMDETFALNMQKSGLPDTMGDLVVDMLGGAIGAFSGFLYLKGQEKGGLLAWAIADFVRLNRRMFRRLDRHG